MTDNASWKILVGDDRMALLPRAIALLAEGVPVPLRRLAAGAGWTEEKVAATLRGIPRVDWDAGGNLIGLGLSLAPTTHRVCVDGRELFTWCAADTLMLPAMLGRPVAVRSTCPTTGTAIRLTVTPQGIESVTPESPVLSEVSPTQGCDDFRSSVCDHGHFFADAAAAEPWRGEHPTGQIWPVAEAFMITRNRLQELGWATTASSW
ncbi:organomercurial lyase MerB [Mycobacterium sp.]|uniref:organomercurial lyase MerB n=1 Tax=Mycobacterium sp. TaxID=1785 RepID=UPI002BAAD8DC|nr:organomercurial lyase MerB [Mycobacterium sp.]HTY33694.1 organomercurial lyase MerB [Mycobacterium sp.]